MRIAPPDDDGPRFSPRRARALIVWPERRPDGSCAEPTAEEIADAALAYTPIEL